MFTPEERAEVERILDLMWCAGVRGVSMDDIERFCKPRPDFEVASERIAEWARMRPVCERWNARQRAHDE